MHWKPEEPGFCSGYLTSMGVMERRSHLCHGNKTTKVKNEWINEVGVVEGVVEDAVRELSYSSFYRFLPIHGKRLDGIKILCERWAQSIFSLRSISLPFRARSSIRGSSPSVLFVVRSWKRSKCHFFFSLWYHCNRLRERRRLLEWSETSLAGRLCYRLGLKG